MNSEAIVVFENDTFLVLQIYLKDGRNIGLDIVKPKIVEKDRTPISTAEVWWHKMEKV